MASILRSYGVALLLVAVLGAQREADAGNIEAKLPTDDGTDKFQVKDLNDNVLLSVPSSGNVGIGTTSPGEILHLERGSGAGVASILVRSHVPGTGSFGKLQFQNALVIDQGIAAEIEAIRPVATWGQESDLLFKTNPGNSFSALAERMRITKDGNVGIGTTDPASKIDVRGISQISDDGVSPDTSTYASFGVTRANASLNQSYFGLTRQSVIPWGVGLSSDANPALIFGIANTSRQIPTPLLYIAPYSGNVGIGTTTPSYNLDVAGSANANQLCIQGVCKAGWPAGITSLGTGTGLTGGTITSTGTISLSINNGATQNCPGTDKVSSISPSGIVTCAPDVDTIGITGSGPLNKLSKWIGGSVIGDSQVYDDGNNVGIGDPFPSQGKLDVASASTAGGYASVRGRLSTTGALGRAIWGTIAPDANGNVLGHAGYFEGQVYINCPNGASNVGSCRSLTGQPDKQYALYVEGNTYVHGTLAALNKTFKIDHPLDPENKYLIHSSIESSDMKNLYDGVTMLDVSGEAWVELPNWFEALNKEFRYQLTCIGGFAPVYIAEEISNNRFKISGGQPGMKVSWQVTGNRHDTWASEHPLVVEENKP